MSESPMKKQALLIGINQYQNLSKLKYARQDAEAVADALKENYGFSEDEIILLTDVRQGRYFPSTKSVIQWQLEDLIKQGDNYDLFIFGFWGHGLICNGQRYLCPQTVMDEEVSDSGLSFDDLQKQLVKVKAKNTCIILDCCQTLNGRGGSETLTPADQTRMKSVVQDIVNSKNKYYPDGSYNAAILNSCSEGQVAYEWDKRKHGIFTAFLLDAMDNQCDSVSSIVSYLGNKVKQTALEMGKVQTPFYIINNDGDIPLPVTLQDSSIAIEVNPQSASSVYGDVFISYKHDNIDLVEPVLKELEKRGISFFIDNDEGGILPSQKFAQQIPEAINNCKALLLFWTEELNQAPTQIEYEIQVAETFHKPIIPYKIGTFKTPDPNTFIFYLTGTSQYIVVRQTKKTILELVNRIERIVSKTNLKPNRISKPKTFPQKRGLKRIGAILLVLFFVAVGITALFSLNDKQPYIVKSVHKAAEQGDIEALYILGENCFKGEDGENKNYVEAVKWYRKAAEKGHLQAQYKLGLCYENGYGGLEDNMEEAVNWWRKAAEQGYPKAQKKLGYCYFNGVGVKQSYEEAAKWYRQAAEQNDSEAQNTVGDCYKNGKGVPQDYAEAAQWYNKAAEQGNVDAQYNLGLCYAEGTGVEKNYAEAMEWFRKAAEQGNYLARDSFNDCYRKAVDFFKQAEYDRALSQIELALSHAEGAGVVQETTDGTVIYWSGHGGAVNDMIKHDNSIAAKWYRKAAEQGNVDAQFQLGVCYANGSGVEKDMNEAAKWYREAAEQGNPLAQNSLADCYRKGAGVEMNIEESVKWYLQSAKQDNADAQLQLGVCYFKGSGVEQDKAEAVEWFRKSAEQGKALAQYNLGRCYLDGIGVEKNYEEAAKWFGQSAEQGNVNAQYNLGLCYEKGAGVEQDNAEAVKWYRKAAEQGNEDAINALKRLGGLSN